MSPNNQRVTDSGLFLRVLESHGVDPNFWCSEEYFQKAGFETTVDNAGFVTVRGDGVRIFPPIHPQSGFPTLVSRNVPIWSDFHGNDFTGPNPLELPFLGNRPEFLDLEYIYDPKEILAMEGSRFRIFRKNHRKFERKYGADNLQYVNLPLGDISFREAIDRMFLTWLENRGEGEEIYDDEVLYRYLIEGYNRAVLVHQRFGLLGINIWDENYRFVNYRYMICTPWPYLDEYMRWLFYSFLNSDKLVNDGGVLDNPGLKRFKDRLNPVRVRKVYSWRK